MTDKTEQIEESRIVHVNGELVRISKVRDSDDFIAERSDGEVVRYTKDDIPTTPIAPLPPGAFNPFED